MTAETVTALIALGGTVTGGIGLEVVKRWLARGKEAAEAELAQQQNQDTTARDLRQELRTDIITLRSALRDAEAESARWQVKYFDLVERYLEVKSLYEEQRRKVVTYDEDAQQSVVAAQKVVENAPPASLDLTVGP